MKNRFREYFVESLLNAKKYIFDQVELNSISTSKIITRNKEIS